MTIEDAMLPRIDDFVRDLDPTEAISDLESLIEGIKDRIAALRESERRDGES